MRKRKLFQVLALLDQEGITSFHSYLASGIEGHSKALLKFYDLCCKRVLAAPVEEDIPLEAFVAGTGIKPGRVDKLCSELMARLQSFLAFQEFRSDAQVQQEMFLRALERRNAGLSDLRRYHEKMLSQLDKAGDSGWAALLRLKLRWIMAEAAIKNRETRSLWLEDFEDLSDLLDGFYRLQKLKLASARANANSIFKHKEVDPFEDFVEGIRGGTGFEKLSPLGKGYFLSLEMFQEASGEERFRDLIALLGEHAMSFSKEEAMDLYGYALNFCIRRSNQGHFRFLGYMSALYKQLLANALLLEDGAIPPAQFKNIVTLHCRLGELDWVRGFIEGYRGSLPEALEADAVLYNEAVLAYHEHDYQRAIASLKEIILRLKEDVFYGLDARIYLWKSYFEHLDHLDVEQVDEMYKLYDSFRVYIDRNEVISAPHKTQYRNFIREFKRFMEILSKEPVSTADLQKLHDELIAMEFISNKSWFLFQVAARVGGP